MDKETLYRNIEIDSTCPCPRETLDKLVEACELRRIKKKTVLVEEGAVCSDFFITAEGVTRIYYFDGAKEVTFGFGGAGTIFLSPSGYLKRLPAYFSMSAVTDCEILWMNKATLDALVGENPDVLLLLFRIAVAQFMSVEVKMQESCKTTKERYLNLVKRKDIHAFASRNINHVDILGEKISDKLIASYLGVIPTHLSNIKNEIATEASAAARKTKAKRDED